MARRGVARRYIASRAANDGISIPLLLSIKEVLGVTSKWSDNELTIKWADSAPALWKTALIDFRSNLLARVLTPTSPCNLLANALPQRLRGAFAEQLTVGASEPAEIPETESKSNLGDGGCVWTAR